MMQSVEGSLKRLQVTYIDLLYVHYWDHQTPPVMRTHQCCCHGCYLFARAACSTCMMDVHGFTHASLLQILHTIAVNTHQFLP